MIDHDQNIREEHDFAKNCSIDIMHVKSIPYDEYRAHPAHNQTFLRHVLEHGLNKAKEIRANPDEPTDDMLLGSVHHAYLSQKPEIQHKYERVPKVDLRTKEGKAVWAALEASKGPGVTQDYQRFVYSYEKLVAAYAAMMGDEDEPELAAQEWVDYNTVRGVAYMGDRAPIIIYERDENSIL